MPYLLGVDDADDVLENRLRKGYVDLVDETTEGVDPDDRERYEMALNTDDYSADYPLQWQDFDRSVIPAIDEGDAVPVTMWIDDDHVVVRLRDETHWAWERLTYSDERFAADRPGRRRRAVRWCPPRHRRAHAERRQRCYERPAAQRQATAPPTRPGKRSRARSTRPG